MSIEDLQSAFEAGERLGATTPALRRAGELLEGLRDDSARVQAQCAIALGKLERVGSLGPLCALLAVAQPYFMALVLGLNGALVAG